ncbi:MAG: hypothetical protein GYB65_17600 [Chloroflexi bacterium]|nr:hypothetical protein [Chloroflexota bacterium]
MRRRMSNWLLRDGRRWVMRLMWRVGRRSAVDTAMGMAMEAVPKATPKTQVQVFSVDGPVTVYVRATQCRVMVCRTDAHTVSVESSVLHAFGLELVAEQDAAGIYIVAKRKPVVGKLTRVDFTVIVPHDAHLVFNLTPGEVVLQEIDGMLELPPPAASGDA